MDKQREAEMRNKGFETAAIPSPSFMRFTSVLKTVFPILNKLDLVTVT